MNFLAFALSLVVVNLLTCFRIYHLGRRRGWVAGYDTRRLEHDGFWDLAQDEAGNPGVFLGSPSEFAETRNLEKALHLVRMARVQRINARDEDGDRLLPIQEYLNGKEQDLNSLGRPKPSFQGDN